MPLNLQEVTQFVEEHIGEFHQSRLDKVVNLQLKEILQTKNPYLFKAKNVTQANEIVESILQAYISSSEESAFGNWLERLAIFINDSVYQGRKAGIDGIDLDFDRDGQRYLVSIKSGPNWGNKDQVAKMVDQFNEARGRLQTSGSRVQPVCVNGCCYGRSNESSEFKSRGNYYKICGARFWELISGDPNLYLELIVPIGHEAETKNQEYQEHYGALVNKMTREFLQDFSDENGFIDWNKLVIFNSTTPDRPPTKAALRKAATEQRRAAIAAKKAELEERRAARKKAREDAAAKKAEAAAKQAARKRAN